MTEAASDDEVHEPISRETILAVQAAAKEKEEEREAAKRRFEEARHENKSDPQWQYLKSVAEQEANRIKEQANDYAPCPPSQSEIPSDSNDASEGRLHLHQVLPGRGKVLCRAVRRKRR